MAKYNPQKIEKKWQRVWDKSGLYWALADASASSRTSAKASVKDGSRRSLRLCPISRRVSLRETRQKKSYILVEFPYPSGEGLHVGHCRPYIAFDIISRKRRLEGFNVLFPMGWDAFGLPTENYAVKTGIHPRKATRKNTSSFKRQQKAIGLSFDWSREINTTDPGYYKWTQWIFLQLFKKGLAYKKKIPINWCPSCKIGLAAEEVLEGSCERCGAKVTKKEKEQWLLKITKYAERLIKDLDLIDYPEKVKTLQRDWIGKSAGWQIKFQITNSNFQTNSKSQIPPLENLRFLTGQASSKHISVFTTRADTLFGATYLILAPEHPVIDDLKSEIRNWKFVEKYIEEARQKTERERASEVKEKTGIELKGLKAINPANGREIPIFVADYILYYYGTGAIMAVPAHDARDWDFAKSYNLSIIPVIKDGPRIDLGTTVYEGEGVLINSGRFTGMKSEDAKGRIGEWLAKKDLAKKAVYYKLRDWIFSRQRYWGEPIPLVFCEKHAWVAVPEKDLPVKLPNVKDYKPTEAGDSPLAKVKNWVNVKCPKCQGSAARETDVMPNWAGSNWYFLRYCDPKNDKKLAEPKKLKYWMPVDWYNGGMEHSTLHLLYSRFIYKFLWDIGAVPKSLGPEPYKKRTSHGVVLGEGSIKMSKSRGNVITPEAVIKQYGADTLRVYEMFMGPFSETIAWDTKGLKGAKRFLDKVWKLFEKTQNTKHRTQIKRKAQNTKHKLEKILHKTIKKVSEDIEGLRFNTAISALMILVNEMSESKEQLTEKNLKTLLLLLAPFAPHLTEELWQKLGQKNSIHQGFWPKYDSKLIKDDAFTLVIQINGKVRDKAEADFSISQAKAKKLALSQPVVQKWLQGKEIKKVVFVPGKLINIVV